MIVLVETERSQQLINFLAGIHQTLCQQIVNRRLKRDRQLQFLVSGDPKINLG
jgi:hypothetical protein